ncbi:hypothetical protein [Polaromonas sp. P5_D5]
MKRDVMPAAADRSVNDTFVREKCLQANADGRKQLSKKERQDCGEKMARAI